MVQTTGFLVEGKPIIDVAIADAVPTPNSVSPTTDPFKLPMHGYKALLDTGADITCLSDKVVRECKLRPTGMMSMTGGSGPSIHRFFIVHIGIFCWDYSDFEGDAQQTRTLFKLPDPLEAPEIRDNRWFDIIIGTDILAQYNFTLRRGGEFTLDLS